MAAVPDDLILKSSPIGPGDAVRERIRLCRAAGVTTSRLSPVGGTLAERLDQLGPALDLIARTDGGSSFPPLTAPAPSGEAVGPATGRSRRSTAARA